ncbi:MAG TPA: extracellular solute-binding protein [Thermomicrobiales bacterium]|nr:extracellular solute-binding protein [Thermomicrobiales bacterium]
MDRKLSIDPKHRDAIEAFARSRTSRRQVLRGAAGLAALGVAGRTRVAAARSAQPSLTPAAISAAQRALRRQSADSAQAAVDAANALDPKPAELNVVYEDSLQTQDPINFSGPMWEELTGIKINTVAKPFPELFAAQVAEHLGATGAYDVLSFPPAWTADFVAQGLPEPLDPYIEQYMAPEDLDDFHPLYKALMNYGGQKYGIFDDGDVIILYYRTDLFGDAANQDDFKAQYGYDLAAPKDWQQYDDIQAFFTEQGGGNSWGGASQRAPGQVYGWFSEEFRNRGGRFFDDETLDAALDSQAGIDTLSRMIASNKTMPPGVETWGFVEVLTGWMAGQLAMIGGTWPPIGRWSEGTTVEQLNWVPETQVQGKVGYSIMPMGHSLHNSGFSLGVSSDSANKEAAYLFIQWMTSPSISLQRVMLPYALRDPYRLSHFSSPEYRGRWATAGDYLDTLQAAADTALLDIIMPGSSEYHTALDQLVTSAQAGTSVEEALATGNAAFNEITDRIGRDSQKVAYETFKALKGSYYEGS